MEKKKEENPKSVLCEHFKAGQCAKGFKCKYSHDLNIQRKVAKIDIYNDRPDGEEEGTMEDWGMEQLEKVVALKSNEYNMNKPTDIVCKHFLDAVEKKQYSCFWVCPNGGKECKEYHYRHALPPGYILKSQMKALHNKMSIEEESKDQRAKVATTTPMTTDLWFQWKKKKIDERDAGLAAQMVVSCSWEVPVCLWMMLRPINTTKDKEAQEQKVDKEAASDRPNSSTSAAQDAKDMFPGKVKAREMLAVGPPKAVEEMAPEKESKEEDRDDDPLLFSDQVDEPRKGEDDAEK